MDGSHFLGNLYTPAGSLAQLCWHLLLVHFKLAGFEVSEFSEKGQHPHIFLVVFFEGKRLIIFCRFGVTDVSV